MLLVAPVGMSLLFLGELTAPAAYDISRSCLSLLRLVKVVILLGPNQLCISIVQVGLVCQVLFIMINATLKVGGF